MLATKFYVGLHQPSDAIHFLDGLCMVSVKRLWNRKSDFVVGEWMMDSGAFTELKDHGYYRHSPAEYATQVRRWSRCGNLVAAVSQDYMCEPIVIRGGAVRGMRFAGTGLSVPEHQRLTIERYDDLLPLCGDTYLMPVLQGYWPDDYVRHLRDYGSRLQDGQWVGVGSVCKRNSDIEEIEQVLRAVKDARPDLRLHGFGVKLTAMASNIVRNCLHSCDSMAWSYSARKQGRDGNDWREASNFAYRINTQPVVERAFQGRLF